VSVFLLIALITLGSRDNKVVIVGCYPTRDQCSARASDLHALTQKNPFRGERYECAQWTVSSCP
jgi:hypothetical protein